MSGLEIFPHPTCEVKGSGDRECLHPISHMASEKWEVRLIREFQFLKYLPLHLSSYLAPTHSSLSLAPLLELIYPLLIPLFERPIGVDTRERGSPRAARTPDFSLADI